MVKTPSGLFGTQEDIVPVVALSTIIRDSRIQPRETISSGTVEEYARVMATFPTLQEHAIPFEPFPPVVVYEDEQGFMWLADGWHRVLAAEHAGLGEIEADIRQGGVYEAIMHAAGANARHGLRPNNRDKRRSVLMLLEHPTVITEQWSDGRVAIAAGVGPTLVRHVRAERAAQMGISAPTERLGTDGKVYARKSAAEPVSGDSGAAVHVSDGVAVVNGTTVEVPSGTVELHDCPFLMCPLLFIRPVWHHETCGRHWSTAEAPDRECPSCHPTEATVRVQQERAVATETNEPLPTNGYSSSTPQAQYTPGVMRAGDSLKSLEILQHVIGQMAWCATVEPDVLAALIPVSQALSMKTSCEAISRYLQELADLLPGQESRREYEAAGVRTGE